MKDSVAAESQDKLLVEYEELVRKSLTRHTLQYSNAVNSSTLKILSIDTLELLLIRHAKIIINLLPVD